VITIRLPGRTASEVLTIVSEIREAGLIQGTDFDFAYHQASHDPVNGHLIKEPYSTFSFHNNSEYSLIFKLKYTK
jgi:hypothetical protein